MNKGSLIPSNGAQFCTLGGSSNKKLEWVLEWAQFTPTSLGSTPTGS